MTKDTNNQTQESIQMTLLGFIGTFNYYRNTVANLEILLTDGCEYVRRELKAFWLFDLITTYQNHPALVGQNFQVWTLKKINNGLWKLTCQDGNQKVLISQEIKFSDFPINEIRIWLVDGLAMLPTEY